MLYVWRLLTCTMGIFNYKDYPESGSRDCRVNDTTKPFSRVNFPASVTDQNHGPIGLLQSTSLEMHTLREAQRREVMRWADCSSNVG